MTIAVSLKVNDGIVLAADSATALMGQEAPTGPVAVGYVYNNANKIFNLRKGLPIGLITWGLGSIGAESISTLVKDLRKELTAGDTNWRVDETTYTIQDVATKVRRFMFEDRYRVALGQTIVPPTYPLGFIVAGYSSGEALAEGYQILVDGAECPEPVPVHTQDLAGIVWQGQPEAITRLILGFGTGLPDLLLQFGVPEEQVAPALMTIQSALQAPVIQPAMPIQDAVDLAEFLVDLTIKFVRFNPGAPTVGGPIEIAAITKHEGFKWIKRKYYYDRDINPEDWS